MRMQHALLKHQIKTRKQEITETLPSKRPPKIAAAQAWARTQRDRLDAQLASSRSAGASEDEQAAREAGEQAAHLRGFATTEFLIDVPAQAAVSIAAFPALTTTQNVLLGVALGAALTYSTLGVLRLIEDPAMPARSLRLARWIGGVLFGLAALGGLFFLSARFLVPDWFAKVEDLIFLSLAVTAEALAVSAGAVIFGARVAERPFRAIRDTEALQERKELLEAFLTWLVPHEPSTTPRLVPEVAHA